MATGRFSAMIGALIWSSKTEKYLFFKRTEARGGKWESVTGRLEQGESFSDALKREVFEETGLQVQTDFILGTTHFFRGAETIENEMVGIHFGCSLLGSDVVQMSEEHTEFRWLKAEEALAFLPPDRTWLRKCIQRAEELRQSLPAEVMEQNRTNGVEI